MNRTIAPLLAVNFVGTLGFSIVTPFLVILVNQWGGNAVAYGVLAASYSFFQLFGAPILGQWSDRIGRRKVLMISQAGTILSWIIFLIAFTLPETVIANVDNAVIGSFALTLPLMILFIARSVDGLTGGNVSVANAYLADISSDEDRSKNFGQMAVSSNLGFVIGPMLAGLLGATIYGEIIPVFGALIISLFAYVLIQFGLKDTNSTQIEAPLEEPTACDLYGHEHKPAYDMQTHPSHGLKEVLALPNMTPLLAINFLVMLGFSFFYVAFPVHAVEGLGWSITEMGIYFAALSVAMIVVQGPVLAYAAEHFAQKSLIFTGGTILALGFLLLLSDTIMVVYLSAGLVALGNGLMWPTFMAVLSKSAGSDLQGTVQGYAQSGGAIASIIGLIAGGVLYVSLGALTFTLATIIIATAAIISLFYNPASQTPLRVAPANP